MTLLVVVIIAYTLRAPLMSFGAVRLVASTLGPYATDAQQEAILDEFGRVARWHAEGRIETWLLIRGMQVTADSPVVAHAAADALAEALGEWPGVDRDRAERVALGYGTMIHSGAGDHASLRELLGGFSSDDPSVGVFFYGESTVLPDGGSITGEDAAVRLDGFEAVVEARASELTPIGPDLRAWLRAKLDAEVGWALRP